MKPTLKWRYYQFTNEVWYWLYDKLTYLSSSCYIAHTHACKMRTLNRNEQQIQEDSAKVAELIEEINSFSNK